MSNLTPKEKAQELVDKYRTYSRMADKYGYNLPSDEIYLAKQCALIAVQEIISLMIKFHRRHIADNSNEITFWNEVRTEIENY